MLIFIPVLVLKAAALAPQQDETGKSGLSKTHIPMAPAVAEDTRPVTLGEAYIVLGRVEAAFGSLVKTPVKGVPEAWKGSSSPATREQLVVELAVIAQEFQSTYKVFPRSQWVNPKLIELPSAAKSDAVYLARLGFIGPVGELVHGPEKSLTMAQFGRQVGFFIGRWSDMTNMPDIKWTPYLQRETETNPVAGSKPATTVPAKKAVSFASAKLAFRLAFGLPKQSKGLV